jgi:hypothetical protein
MGDAGGLRAAKFSLESLLSANAETAANSENAARAALHGQV